ncbi:hypothetical protein [Paenibacillus herberti]|uniref:Uncharacterized protein n=1 Tax=Paenibacillus herberti TaxID=1619309 RepID=A0A229NXA0_9BACL|nr:hypothetical protein [Paenibacillus herberti]OXM14395.1 hypothetical protein CGZ75_15730 [Paenibacillus herberti]
MEENDDAEHNTIHHRVFTFMMALLLMTMSIAQAVSIASAYLFKGVSAGKLLELDVNGSKLVTA